jgi:hypothetical protein
MKKILFTLILIGTSLGLISWGSSGHYWISYKSTLSFPASMNQFMVWRDSLANHGSDADDRKSFDPNESMRHYIDIDNYSEFNSTGRIESTYDSAVAIHGLNFVENEGIIPWSTKTMYDSLKLAFQQHDWHAAMLHASDLGHYVGDGHMPLHITKNYNGGQTGQTGVHSRYESNMVYDYVSYLNVYSGDTVHFVNNVQKYIFDYLYINYTYKDSVLNADTYAQNVAGNNTSSQYYQAFFNKSKNFTILLWHNASHALAELIYTAWVEAGSPIMVTDIYNPFASSSGQFQIYPNPASNMVSCKFNLSHAETITLSFYDLTGNKVFEKTQQCNMGINAVGFDFTSIAPGKYFCIIKTTDFRYSSPILIIN